MTLIIAHRDGWMAADRRTVFESSLIGPYRLDKIKRGRTALFACAGNGVFADLVQEAIALSPPDELRAVAQIFREKGAEIGGYAIALTAAGICEITSKGSVMWLEASYWAIGSGYQFALGYLAGTSQGDSSKVTADTAKQAINFASTRTNDVGDGYQVEMLAV